MADIAIQDVPAAGLAALTMNAAAGSQTIPAVSASSPGSKSTGGWAETMLVAVVRNADASSHDVTINGLAAVTVAAGAIAVIPVPNPGINAAAQTVTWSATTSMTIGLARIGVGY
jgi:hypothetical protein